MPKVVGKSSFNFTDFATLADLQTLFTMKLAYFRDLVALQQRLLITPLRFLLIPFSWLYAVGVWIRNWLYALGVFRVRTLPCTVISVGNIAVGGTGKTPVVIAIAKHFQKEGIRVAILLRGYKRHPREKVTVVSDGKKVCVSPRESGDEAYMLARHLSDVPIVVGRQRYLAGQVALSRFNVDVLLLDDAYQHRQLARDVDILTLPATHPFGNPKGLLPAGTLREPSTALRRADIVLLTHANTPKIAIDAKKAVKQLAPNALILETIHQPTQFYPLHPRRLDPDSYDFKIAHDYRTSNHGKSDNLINHSSDFFRGKRLLAVCGIGNPESFVATLMRCSPESVELLAFPDHHIYTETDGQRIYDAFRAAKADLIVTTQKDEQKLVNLAEHYELPIVVLTVMLVVTEGDERLTDVLLASIRGK